MPPSVYLLHCSNVSYNYYSNVSYIDLKKVKVNSEVPAVKLNVKTWVQIPAKEYYHKFEFFSSHWMPRCFSDVYPSYTNKKTNIKLKKSGIENIIFHKSFAIFTSILKQSMV